MNSASARQTVALTVFRDAPAMFRKERLDSVVARRVEVGITPYEGKLAGGHSYKLIVDPSVWNESADPLTVMRRQSARPDRSQIWVTLRNSAQFAREAGFWVRFTEGAAVEIVQLD